MSNLVLMRHGQSVWNKQNLFTGFKDVDLTEEGIQEAVNAGHELKDKGLKFDVVFTSTLKRAIETTEIALRESGQEDLIADMISGADHMTFHPQVVNHYKWSSKIVFVLIMTRTSNHC